MVQQAGASARARLIAAAAKRWNAPASECAAAMSKVTHSPSGRTFRFGELAVEAAAIKLDKEPALSGRISTSSSAGGWRAWTCRSDVFIHAGLIYHAGFFVAPKSFHIFSGHCTGNPSRWIFSSLGMAAALAQRS